MAFRATTITQAQGLRLATDTAGWVKGLCQNAVSALAGNVTPTQIFQLVDNLRAALGQLNSAAAVPGITAYAQEQYNDANYNIAAEFTAMVNAINGVIAWVVTNFPASGGYAQAYSINADGSRTERVFTPAQTAGLVSALNSCAATIA